ncbi:MAG: hypothetical protein ACK559_08180, partial [bacterium]
GAGGSAGETADDRRGAGRRALRRDLSRALGGHPGRIDREEHPRRWAARMGREDEPRGWALARFIPARISRR